VTITSAEITALLSFYLGPFLRIGALMMVVPVFGSAVVPMRVRLILALALTVVVASNLPPPQADIMGAAGLPVLGQQLLLGIAMGLILEIAFTAINLAGQVVSMTMGLGFAVTVDPNHGASSTVISQQLHWLALMIFLSFDGHLAIIRALLDSFHALPVGPLGIGREGLQQLVMFGGQMFAGAVRVALPALTALLTVNLAFGVVSRAVPSLNLFSVGLPITLMVGLLVLMWTLHGLSSAVVELSGQAFAGMAFLASEK